jgi:hypothetical protein
MESRRYSMLLIPVQLTTCIYLFARYFSLPMLIHVRAFSLQDALITNFLVSHELKLIYFLLLNKLVNKNHELIPDSLNESMARLEFSIRVD